MPRHNVFEMTNTRLLIPLTPEPVRLKHQRIHENTFTVCFILSKKDVAMQTVPLPSKKDIDVQTVLVTSCQQQTVETSTTDGHQSQLFSSKTYLQHKICLND